MSTDDSSGFQPPQSQSQSQSQQPVPSDAVPPFAPPQYPQPGQPPQFGAFPQQPGGYQQPYGGYPPAQFGYGYGTARPRPPQPLSKVLPILELVFAVAYILVGLGMILALNHRTSLANQLNSASAAAQAADDGSAGVSANNLINTLSWVAILVFIGALIVFAVWRQSLRTSLGPSGQFGSVMQQSGYMVFRLVWLASIILSFVASSTGSTDSLEGVISLDNRMMLYYALRTVAGVVLLVLTLRLMRISQRVYQQQYFGPNVPVGF